MEATKKMGIKNTNIDKIIDLVVIVIIAVGSLSLVRYVTFDLFPLPCNIGLFLFMFLAYSLRFGLSYHLSFFSRYGKNPLILSFIFLYVWETFQSMINGYYGLSATYLFFICFAFLAMEYMYRVYRGNCQIEDVLKPYSYYAIYSCMAITLCAILIYTGLLSQYDNPIEVKLFADNADKGRLYYFPGHLSVVAQESRIFSLINLPSFCGLSHEPHVLCYTLYPAVLLTPLLFRKKNISGFLFSFLILVPLALVTSATAIFVLAVALFANLLWNMLIKGRVGSSIVLIVLLLVGSVFFVQSDIYYAFDEFLSYKLIASDSADENYYENLLSYVVTPNGVVGRGIAPDITVASGYFFNIGYISSFLVLVFYFLLVVNTVSNFFSKNIVAHYTGLASFYYCLHSLKTSVLSFHYTDIVFIVFVLIIANDYRKKTINILH